MFYIKLFIILTFLFTKPFLESSNFFKFESNKTDNLGGSLKYEFLKKIKEIFNIDVFIETGTYIGETTTKAADIFQLVYTMELDKKIYLETKKKLDSYNNVKSYCGSSPEILQEILPNIKGNILFWLDAHYCGQGTAMDVNAKNQSDSITAIRREIEVIKKHKIKDIVLLIDDIRGFGSKEEDCEYLGSWAYPTLHDLCCQILEIHSNFDFVLLGDSLLVYDKTKYNISFSDVVKACTKSRLLYLKNDMDLIEAEKIISNAQAEEREFLNILCKEMIQYPDIEFHHRLWYALLKMNEKNYGEAYNQFMKIINEHNYKHSRIFWYVDQALKSKNKS